MKLSEFKDKAHFFSGKVSEISRQLALAGIAIIWIFRQTSSSNFPEIPRDLVMPLFLLTLSLVFDLLQYIYSSIWLSLFYRIKEKTVSSDTDIKAPKIFPNIGYVIWVTKFILTIVAYWLIIFNFLLAKSLFY